MGDKKNAKEMSIFLNQKDSLNVIPDHTWVNIVDNFDVNDGQVVDVENGGLVGCREDAVVGLAS